MKPPIYYKYVGKNVKAFVRSEGRGTYITLPSSWVGKSIYVTFADRTEIIETPRIICNVVKVYVPAIYANQVVMCQLAENYE